MKDLAKILAAFAGGALVGAAVALLTAPKSGAETRAQIIALAKEKSIVEANKEIVNLTLQASSKLLERSVNEDDDKKFVDDFVKKMKGENK